MSETARPIHIPGAQALESVRQSAHAALVAWGSQWLSGWQENDSRIAALRVDANAGALQSAVTEYQAVCASSGCMWVRRTTADCAAFGHAVAGSELMPRSTFADEWVAGVVEQAWGSLNRTLAAALLGAVPGSASTPPAALPRELLAFGSGAVHLECEPLGLHAVVDSSVWRSVPPERRTARALPAIESLERSLQSARLRLEITLGSVEVALPDVLDLQCGDVLRMRHRLHQPLAVMCEGKPLALALLGEQQGRKCVQLVAGPQ